ncbi:unnamed protein product [Boreogadus saida]
MSDAEWEELLEGFDERGYLSARRWRPGDDPYALYAFNQRESERIPSNRALRDTRHYRALRDTPHYRALRDTRHYRALRDTRHYRYTLTNAHLHPQQSPEGHPALQLLAGTRAGG